MQKEKDELLSLLIKDAYFKERVILSSGQESDYYIDARRVTLSARGAYLCGTIILEMVEGEKIKAIGGPTLGADPMLGAIAVLSLQIDRPLNTFIIRKAPKPYGRQQQIEGPFLNKGDKVVLIDDVATTGKALLSSIDVLRNSGIVVEKAICIVDRNQGAVEALGEKDCKLVSIFNISDILNA